MPNHVPEHRNAARGATQEDMHREFMRKRREAKAGKKGKGKSKIGEAVEAGVMSMPGGAGIISKVTNKIKQAFD